MSHLPPSLFNPQPDRSDPDLVYSVRELAAMLKVSPKTILQAIHTGQLDARKIGKGYKITARAIAAFWAAAPGREVPR